MNLAPTIERVGLSLRQMGIVLPWLPAPLVDTYLAMISARAIMAATSLGVFQSLAEQPRDAADLAERLSLDLLGCEALLSALHALGYVHLDERRYRNSSTARRFLEPSADVALDAWVGEFNYETWNSLNHLEECLRDASDLGLHERARDDPFWDVYMRSLFQLSRLSADVVAKAVRVSKPKRMLDIAGGHGGYSMAMCRRHPGLRATVLDLPGAVGIGRRIVREAGMQSKVEHKTMDVLEAGTELGRDYDVAMVNAILHNLSPQQCQTVLSKAKRAMRAGGKIVVVELEHPPQGRRGSLVATLPGLLFVGLTRSRTYDAATLKEWLKLAGFRRVRAKRIRRLTGGVVLTGLV